MALVSPAWEPSALQTIRFAAANHLCVDLRYAGSVRSMEACSLRSTQAGDVLSPAQVLALANATSAEALGVARAIACSDRSRPCYQRDGRFRPTRSSLTLESMASQTPHTLTVISFTPSSEAKLTAPPNMPMSTATS